MKKFLALFISIFYLLSANMSFAACSNLYFVKDANKNYVKSLVEPEIYKSKYEIQKKDPYYAILKTNGADYVVVILQQTGNNLFYYFKSTNSNVLDKAILKSLKSGGLDYEKAYCGDYV